MAVHFHTIKVKKVSRETPDCISVVFDIPEKESATFSYREGQNITIRKVLKDTELRRSYSICNAPYENELKIAIKKVDGGVFSTYANESLRPGDELEILPPTGKFNAHVVDKKNPSYLAIAAGSGITPVISIIKHTLSTQPDSSFTLLYGNQSRGSIIFLDELQNIKDSHLNRFSLINILSRERTDTDIHFGRIDGNKLQALSSLISFSSFDGAYLCGPEEMIFTAKSFLERKGISEKKIHFELFTAPGQKQQATGKQKPDIKMDTGPMSKLTITLDGRSFEMDLAYKGINILDAALRQGADLPYACKGGVCATCKAKVTEGKVVMDNNYALESDEVEQGFILTCQSHPCTDHVKVNFDIK